MIVGGVSQQTIPLWFLKLSHLATLTCRGKSGEKTRDSERRERFFGHRYPCVPRLPKIHGEVPKKDKHFQNEVVRWQNFIFPSFFALYRYTCFVSFTFFYWHGITRTHIVSGRRLECLDTTRFAWGQKVREREREAERPGRRGSRLKKEHVSGQPRGIRHSLKMKWRWLRWNLLQRCWHDIFHVKIHVVLLFAAEHWCLFCEFGRRSWKWNHYSTPVRKKRSLYPRGYRFASATLDGRIFFWSSHMWCLESPFWRPNRTGNRWLPCMW